MPGPAHIHSVVESWQLPLATDGARKTGTMASGWQNPSWWKKVLAVAAPEVESVAAAEAEDAAEARAEDAARAADAAEAEAAARASAAAAAAEVENAAGSGALTTT